jgi:hypothetical protein
VLRVTRVTRVASVLAVVVVVSACGTPERTATGSIPPSVEPSDSTSPPTEQATRLDRCGDVDEITTDVVTTIGGSGNLDPVYQGVLMTYAAEHPDTFAGLWIDREAGGTAVLAFTDDPEPHRIAIAARAPTADDVAVAEPRPAILDARPIGDWDQRFDVVRTTHTEAQLTSVLEAAMDVLSGTAVDGAGLDITRNRVGLSVPVPVTPADVAELADQLAAELPPAMFCLEAEVVERVPDPIDPDAPLDLVALPGPDGTYPPDTPVQCGGVSFELGDLEAPTPRADVDPGLAAVLDDWLSGPEGSFWPQEGWLLLRADDESADFVHIGTDVSFVSAEMGRNGWIWAGASGGEVCDVVRLLPPGYGAVDWELDPSFPRPDPTATEIHLLATELGCTSGSELGDRLLGPQVVETDDAVRIVVASIALTGSQTCPGNPPTAVTVTLDAPLGDRSLVDGRAIAPITELVDR